MKTWEFHISRRQSRRVAVVADSMDEAIVKARDEFRVILTNNQDPWVYDEEEISLPLKMTRRKDQ